MSDDTIREDVPGQTDETAAGEQERQPSARELAMEKIAAKRNEHFEEESGLSLGEDDSDPEEILEEKALSKEPAEEATAEEPEKTVRVKVDGEEMDVPLDEVVRQYQKNSAADRRLAEATRLLREAQEARPVVQAEQFQVEAAPDTQELIAALFEGDADKAQELFGKLLGGRREPTLDPEQIVQAVAPRIKQQMAVESALERFKTDYADVVADPYLLGVADSFLNSEIQAGKTYPEALMEAGKQTRDWLHQKAGVKADPPPTTTRIQKLERKADIENIRTANVSVGTTEEPQKTASDVIAEMRRARGYA